jgi:hypothetical protein
MTRLFTLATILIIAGCGTAPSGESSSAFTNFGPLCEPGYFPVSLSLQVSSSSYNPWGAQTGVVVVYGDDPNMEIYGFNGDTNQVVWFMDYGTYADVDKFESYPQSKRFCGGGTNNPGAGSGKNPPDPRWLGQCAPSTLPSPDAFDSYWYGPYDFSNTWPVGNSWCSKYGEGGCVPLSCSALRLGCGWQSNNCGRSVYCGNCPKPPPHCPCGGTYPNHCMLCQ